MSPYHKELLANGWSLRAAGLSIETSNHYVRRLKQFCRWAVRSRRLSESPVECLTLVNARTDRRRERRVLEPDELR